MNTTSLICPPTLQPGDTVAITAPSSPVSASVLESSIRSIEFLGMKALVMESCRQQHGYLAGTDRQRASDINTAFADPEVRGIFCLRGGFGATRILPLLDFDSIRKAPKIFTGYSDITALHVAFNQLCGFITFHGPMPNTKYHHMDPFSLKSLRQYLFSGIPRTPVSNPPGEPIHVLHPGKASGLLTGGNISLLAGTLGSPYEIDTRGKILFLEEVGERPYRLDKALTALALAGKFRDCSGIILGTFAECEEPEDPDTVPASTVIAQNTLELTDIFQEVILPFEKPTLLNFRAGHIYPQSTLPFGASVSFHTDYPALSFSQ